MLRETYSTRILYLVSVSTIDLSGLELYLLQMLDLNSFVCSELASVICLKRMNMAEIRE